MHDRGFPHRLSYYHWWDELRMHCIIIAFVLPRTHSITRIEVGVRAALRFSVPIPSMLGIIIICATISRVGSTHGGNICECITLRSSGGSSFMIYKLTYLEIRSSVEGSCCVDTFHFPCDVIQNHAQTGKYGIPT